MSEALNLPLWAILAGLVVTLFAAAVQGTIGLGFSVISVPLLSLVHPSLAPVPQLIMSLPLTLIMLWRERHAVQLKGVIWVLVGRVPGMGLGILLLTVASHGLLDVMIGILVLGGVGILSTERTVPRNRWTEMGSGVVSGASGLISAIGGPPLAFLYKDADGPTIRANLALIFAVGMVMSLGGRYAAGRIEWMDLGVALILLPALLLGQLLSNRLTSWIEGPRLKRSVLAISAVAALALIGRALFSQS